MSPELRISRLNELEPGEQGDCFVLLAGRDRATTRDGKPYYRVTFRDAGRSCPMMVWSDTPWFAACDSTWQVGKFYKIRCLLRDSPYGPQIELDRIREVQPADREQGFDPFDFTERTRFDVPRMLEELRELSRQHIANEPLQQLVLVLLEEHAGQIQTLAAAAYHHHAFAGGYLEHVLSVTRTAVYLAEKYGDYYPEMQPPLSVSLVVAGAILHDIGKLLELRTEPTGTVYTARGRLVGHILLGRDLVRDKALALGTLDPETLLRLEHIIISHQNLPEWGSPIAPHTPEALLVHAADDLDAKFHMLARALHNGTETDAEGFTSKDNPLRRHFFRRLSAE